VKKISRNRSVVVIWTVQIKFGHFKQNGIVGKTILKKKKKKKSCSSVSLRSNLFSLFLYLGSSNKNEPHFKIEIEKKKKKNQPILWDLLQNNAGPEKLFVAI
jgi:hypothetical protein